MEQCLRQHTTMSNEAYITRTSGVRTLRGGRNGRTKKLATLLMARISKLWHSETITQLLYNRNRQEGTRDNVTNTRVLLVKGERNYTLNESFKIEDNANHSFRYQKFNIKFDVWYNTKIYFNFWKKNAIIQKEKTSWKRPFISQPTPEDLDWYSSSPTFV